MDPAARRVKVAAVEAIPLACIALLLGIRFWRFDVDDAYITYRIAEHIGNGIGWVYNIGERVNGATSVLWTLLLALGFSVFGHTSALAHIIGTCAALVAAVILRDVLTRGLGPLVAAGASFLFVTHPLLLWTYGLETQLYMAVTLLAIWAYCETRAGLLGLALGLSLLTRPDAVVLSGFLLGHWIYRDRQVPWRAIGPAVGMLLPWTIFSIVYFGSLVPNTLAAKMAQGRSGAFSLDSPWLIAGLPLFARGMWFWTTFSYAYPERFRVPLLLGIGFLVVVGLTTVRRWHPSMIAMGVWGLGQLVAYSILKVPHYHWYYAPLVLAGVVTIAAGLAEVASWGAVLHRRMAQVVILLGLMPLFLSHAVFAYKTTSVLPGPGEVAYETVGRWLQRYTPAEASVAAAEIGTIGYFSNRRMIDMVGVIDKQGPAELARANWGWWLTMRAPDFVLVHDPPWVFEQPVFGPSGPVGYEALEPLGDGAVGTLRLLRRVAPSSQK